MILNKHKEPTLALSLIVFGLLALVPIFASPYWTGQTTRYLILGIFAMSLSLVWGRAGILCFGQAMFFGLGGYSLGVFTLGILGSSALTIAWIAIPTSVIVTSFFVCTVIVCTPTPTLRAGGWGCWRFSKTFQMVGVEKVEEPRWGFLLL